MHGSVGRLVLSVERAAQVLHQPLQERELAAMARCQYAIRALARAVFRVGALLDEQLAHLPVALLCGRVQRREVVRVSLADLSARRSSREGLDRLASRNVSETIP